MSRIKKTPEFRCKNVFCSQENVKYKLLNTEPSQNLCTNLLLLAVNLNNLQKIKTTTEERGRVDQPATAGPPYPRLRGAPLQPAYAPVATAGEEPSQPGGPGSHLHPRGYVRLSQAEYGGGAREGKHT